MQVSQPTLQQASLHIKQVEMVEGNQLQGVRPVVAVGERAGGGGREFWAALTSAYDNANHTSLEQLPRQVGS